MPQLPLSTTPSQLGMAFHAVLRVCLSWKDSTEYFALARTTCGIADLQCSRGLASQQFVALL